METEKMTPRERWLATFDRRPLDRLATDFWGTDEFIAKLDAAAGCSGESMRRKFKMDTVRWRGAREKNKRPGVDIWGISYTKVDYGTGYYEEAATHPLAGMTSVSEIERYPWPSPDDLDYEPVFRATREDDGYRIRLGGSYEPFLLYCYLRGMEQAFEDLVCDQDIADAILTRIFDFHYERNRRIMEAAGKGGIDIFYLAEDLGGQNGPLFSLEMYRRFFLPGQIKMAELARSYGIRIFYHTDGAARVFIPDLIERVGIDILNPLQWRCPGMELPELVRDFAAHVVFHGGIDNQHTLPFGTTDEVRQQVRWCFEIMQKYKARWICAPCHRIQAVGPAENAIAMYDEASKLPVNG